MLAACLGAAAPRVGGAQLSGYLVDEPWPEVLAAARVPQQVAGGTSPDLAPAALSLVVPGAGQHRLGQGRKWIYAALEVVGWAAFLERRSAGGDYRDRYRDYAWNVGRIQNGSRVDGDFDYYETLSHWMASGAYDADPTTGGVQPEMDPLTYNGAIWERAVRIFVPGGGPVPPTDPAYLSALSYYDERAYHDDFLWDWSAAPDGRQVMGGLISDSDARFRQATTALGVVIANHLISATDAYLSARGRRAPLRLGVVPEWRAGSASWRAIVTVPLGP